MRCQHVAVYRDVLLWFVGSQPKEMQEASDDAVYQAYDASGEGAADFGQTTTHLVRLAAKKL